MTQPQQYAYDMIRMATMLAGDLAGTASSGNASVDEALRAVQSYASSAEWILIGAGNDPIGSAAADDRRMRALAKRILRPATSCVDAARNAVEYMKNASIPLETPQKQAFSRVIGAVEDLMGAIQYARH